MFRIIEGTAEKWMNNLEADLGAIVRKSRKGRGSKIEPTNCLCSFISKDEINPR